MLRSARSWLTPSLLAACCLSCGPSTANRPSSAEPRRLWARELGPGYSGIVAREDRLYTMYRAGESEVVVCLDAGTGEKLWEHRYRSTPLAGQDTEYGEGPNAAPLLAGDRLYTIGFAGRMHCLDAATGEVVWSRDLLSALGAKAIELGYSASPVEYGETIISLVGGSGHGAAALDKKDGSVVWTGLDFDLSFASPAIMSIHGEDQLVALMATEVVGADPSSGKLLWRYAIRNQYPQNICAPIRIDDDLIFVSTTEAGSRGLRIVKDDGFRVEEAWSTTRVQCFYDSFARIGDTIYGTSGMQSGPRMSAIDGRTGEIAWRVRGFELSHVLAIDGCLILLDDEGKLTLAEPTADGLTVLWETRILSPPSLTPPTLQGKRLYARDQHEIVALELG